ncbi:MAG: Precorrin-3B methylase [Verrucomicrobiales bacterium]
MPAKKNKVDVDKLTGNALIKEVNRRIRLARTQWVAHNNAATRRERDRAIELYEQLSKAEREKVPQVLRVWLRYRSEKYFGKDK